MGGYRHAKNIFGTSDHRYLFGIAGLRRGAGAEHQDPASPRPKDRGPEAAPPEDQDSTRRDPGPCTPASNRRRPQGRRRQDFKGPSPVRLLSGRPGLFRPGAAALLFHAGQPVGRQGGAAPEISVRIGSRVAVQLDSERPYQFHDEVRRYYPYREELRRPRRVRRRVAERRLPAGPPTTATAKATTRGTEPAMNRATGTVPGSATAVTGAGTVGAGDQVGGHHFSGNGQQAPSEKPAGWQWKARLKRERMFPIAMSVTNSTSWASVKCCRSSAEQLVADDRRRGCHADGQVEDEFLDRAEQRCSRGSGKGPPVARR